MRVCLQTREKKGKKQEWERKLKKGRGKKNYSSRKTDRGRKMRKGSKREKRGRDTHSAERSTRPTVFVLIHSTPIWTCNTLRVCVACLWVCVRRIWLHLRSHMNRHPLPTQIHLREISSASTSWLWKHDKESNMIITRKSWESSHSLDVNWADYPNMMKAKNLALKSVKYLVSI